VSAQPDDAGTATASANIQTVASRSDADAKQDRSITTQALQEGEGRRARSSQRGTNDVKGLHSNYACLSTTRVMTRNELKNIEYESPRPLNN
jgi:hypothetical protein